MRVNRVLADGTAANAGRLHRGSFTLQIDRRSFSLRSTASASSKPIHSKERIPMNPANLPFDSEAMLQGLRGWVECESPTWDAAAVNRMLELAGSDMATMA